MKTRIGEDVAQALAAAKRTPGWHNRSPAIRRFEIGRYGLNCTLYVVPARAWTSRRDDRASQTWRAQA